MKGLKQLIQYWMLGMIIFITWPANGFAQSFQPLEDVPIHEAFVPPVTGLDVLDAIAQEPPNLINERIPAGQDDQEMLWIPGYWSWSAERNDFIWISGVWRRPPPGQFWVPGSWEQFDEGWVYLKGFWSPTPEAELTFLSNPPPDAIEEDIPDSPDDNYFWVTGYWIYSTEIDDYIWLPGEWKQMDPNWIFTPAQYIWQPEGYVFVPAYWDWLLEERGQAYAPISVERDALEREPAFFDYEPTVVVEPVQIIRQLVPYYPNYVHLYHHYYHFYPNAWANSPVLPPWWGWSNWWGFNWHDHWALWWWYTHPGYPQPYWMTPAISGLIPPPSPNIIAINQIIVPPPIVTAIGVVPPAVLLGVVENVHVRRGKRAAPIIPGNPRLKSQLARALKRFEPAPEKILKPTGRASPALNPRDRKDVPKPKFKNTNQAQLAQRQMENRLQKLTPEQRQQLRQKLRAKEVPSKPTAEAVNQSRANLSQNRAQIQQRLQRQLQKQQLQQRSVQLQQQKGQNPQLDSDALSKQQRLQQERQRIQRNLQQKLQRQQQLRQSGTAGQGQQIDGDDLKQNQAIRQQQQQAQQQRLQRQLQQQQAQQRAIQFQQTEPNQDQAIRAQSQFQQLQRQQLQQQRLQRQLQQQQVQQQQAQQMQQQAQQQQRQQQLQQQQQLQRQLQQQQLQRQMQQQALQQQVQQVRSQQMQQQQLQRQLQQQQAQQQMQQVQQQQLKNAQRALKMKGDDD